MEVYRCKGVRCDRCKLEYCIDGDPLEEVKEVLEKLDGPVCREVTKGYLHYWRHREKELARKKEYYLQNKERELERAKRWREDNLERVKKAQRRYKEEHREEIKRKRHERYIKEKEAAFREL